MRESRIGWWGWGGGKRGGDKGQGLKGVQYPHTCAELNSENSRGAVKQKKGAVKEACVGLKKV